MAELPAIYTARLPSSAATANATSVTAVTTRLRRITGFNAAATGRWLKLYDQATVPANTDTPRKSYYLPAQQGFVFDLCDYFVFGLGYRIVTGSLDNDNTAGAAGDILGLNVDYR